jgi:hypothetical protein
MKDIYCHNVGTRGAIMNTKWLHNVNGNGEVKGQCAVTNKVTMIIFTFCEKIHVSHQRNACTAALTAAQRQTSVISLQHNSTLHYTKTVHAKLALTLSGWVQECTWEFTSRGK